MHNVELHSTLCVHKYVNVSGATLHGVTLHVVTYHGVTLHVATLNEVTQKMCFPLPDNCGLQTFGKFRI